MLTLCGTPVSQTEWIRREWTFPTRPLDFEQAYPFYTALVPKDFEENLRFREAMIRWGCASKDNAHTLWMMCKRDILFWINVFVWAQEPRGKAAYLDAEIVAAFAKAGTKSDFTVVPFISWEFQDYTIYEIERSIPVRNLVIEKSRDMGATWVILLVLLHRWIFRDGQKFTLASRNKDLVDDQENPDALFPKMRFVLERLPRWLQPIWRKREMNLPNDDNGSRATGATTTSDIGRGGRSTAALADEAAKFPDPYGVDAALVNNTNCIIYNSTPAGAVGPFYDKTAPGSKFKKLTLHWVLHPLKSKGLYFDADNNPRSPWYDEMCQRLKIPALIAQELDINYQAASYQFFMEKDIRKIEAETVREPMYVGEIKYEMKDGVVASPSFINRPAGGLKLWCPIRADGRPVPGIHAAFCDVSMGTGASNSALYITDRISGEQLLEYADPHIPPERYAEMAVAICLWFWGPKLGWESNGPGRPFGSRVMELRYGNVYLREDLKKHTRDVKPHEIGFQSGVDEKSELLVEFRRAIMDGDLIVRSESLCHEMRQYIVLPNGKIVHAKSEKNIDPTGAGSAHGDRVIAAAGSWWVAKGLPSTMEVRRGIPEHCPAARLKRVRERNREREEALTLY